MFEDYKQIKTTDLKSIKALDIKDIKDILIYESIERCSTIYYIFLNNNKLIIFNATTQPDKSILNYLKSTWKSYKAHNIYIGGMKNENNI